MIDKPTEKLTWGDMRIIAIPLSHENDIELILTFKERNSPHIQDSKRFLIAVKIVYKNKIIVNDIVGIYRFIVSLKVFTDRKNLFTEKDIYFSVKTKDKIERLQCNFDKDLYIGRIEAMQMGRILQDAFIGYSKAYLFDSYTTDTATFKTIKETRHHSEYIEISRNK